MANRATEIQIRAEALLAAGQASMYYLWRFEMFAKGYGTYDTIDQMVQAGQLLPCETYPDVRRIESVKARQALALGLTLVMAFGGDKTEVTREEVQSWDMPELYAWLAAWDFVWQEGPARWVQRASLEA